MDEIRVVDTTLRDGNLSLWALSTRTGMMLPALPHLDEAGYESMEFFNNGNLKKFVREHKENPWDWLRLGTKQIKRTRLRYHGGQPRFWIVRVLEKSNVGKCRNQASRK